MKTEKICKKVKKMLDKKRYEHTLGVAYTASCLAMKHGEDIKKAYLAGILHDCAKNFDEKKMIRMCEKNGVFISDTEYDSPFLLHGKVAAIVASKRFKITDEDLLNALRNHTTGRENMSLLEKIVFVADYIEMGRSMAVDLKTIREMAFTDLDKTLVMILENTLNYLKSKNANIDKKTEETFLYYKGIV